VKKHIARSELILIAIAAFIALLYVFFFFPFITAQVPPTPGPGGPLLHPCSIGFCTFEAPETLYSYLGNQTPISINWSSVIISYLIISAVFYLELRLLIYIVQPQKKKPATIFLKKFLAVVTFIAIFLYIIYILLVARYDSTHSFGCTLLNALSSCDLLNWPRKLQITISKDGVSISQYNSVDISYFFYCNFISTL